MKFSKETIEKLNEIKKHISQNKQEEIVQWLIENKYNEITTNIPKSLHVRGDLEYPHNYWFNEINTKFHHKSRTQTLNEIIEVAYKQLFNENTSVDFSIGIIEEIKELLNKSEIRQKTLYQLDDETFTVSKFIQEAIKSKIKELRKDVLTLTHFDFKVGLSDFDKKIANVVERYERENDEGITAEYIGNELNRNMNEIEKRLEYYYFEGRLKRQDNGSGIYIYHT